MYMYSIYYKKYVCTFNWYQLLGNVIQYVVYCIHIYIWVIICTVCCTTVQYPFIVCIADHQRQITLITLISSGTLRRVLFRVFRCKLRCKQCCHPWCFTCTLLFLLLSPHFGSCWMFCVYKWIREWPTPKKVPWVLGPNK